jgi:hypothetical protein
MAKPYISFVFSARNDNHCEDFISRFQNSLDILRDLGNKNNLSFEIIIVEWSPLPGFSRLEEVLSFKKGLNSTVRIITVPNDIHKSVPDTPFDAAKADEITFFQNIALNVGARRANGEYILCTNADIIFNEELIRFLSTQQLSQKYFYRIYRHDVKKILPENMTSEQMIEFCYENSSLRGEKVEANKLHRRAAGDFLLMAKNCFEKIRGYAEIRCDGLKIDGDILDSASHFFKQNVLEDPMRVYHQFHVNRYEEAYDRKLHVRRNYRDVYRQTKGLINKMSIKYYKKRKNPNGKSWGLIKYFLSEEQII